MLNDNLRRYLMRIPEIEGDILCNIVYLMRDRKATIDLIDILFFTGTDIEDDLKDIIPESFVPVLKEEIEGNTVYYLGESIWDTENTTPLEYFLIYLALDLELSLKPDTVSEVTEKYNEFDFMMEIFKGIFECDSYFATHLDEIDKGEIETLKAVVRKYSRGIHLLLDNDGLYEVSIEGYLGVFEGENFNFLDFLDLVYEHFDLKE